MMSNEIECRTSSVVPKLFVTSWNIAPQAPVSMDRQSRILQWVAIPFSRRSSPGSNLGLPLCEQTLYCLSHQGDSAAAAAKSLQSCPTLCDPIDGSPPGSPIPGILQARTLEWVAISFSNA